MAAQAFEINVYAPLPKKLEDSEDWHWVKCLSIPQQKFIELQLSHRPFKWVRYATGVVIGAEGLLSTRCDVITDVDYRTVVLPTASFDLYYHTSTAERQRMFPIDPDIQDTHMTSSVHTDRWNRFRNDIVARDRSCLITGCEEIFCDAVHLVPHSKGDAVCYIYSHFQPFLLITTIVHLNLHSVPQS
jgi:hypothetical protein